jgi:multidrug resistance efflux pump
MPQQNTYRNLTPTNQRSTLVTELITSKPPLFVRYSIVIFFFIITMLAVVCWFVQYRYCNGKSTIKQHKRTKRVITHTDGKLTKIVVTENQTVTKGQILAYMETWQTQTL